MSKFPDGFPADGMVRLQGREYITHTGLVWLATQRGPWSSSVDYIERRWAEDGLPLYIECGVTVTSGEVSHTAIGDASRANVGKMIATALPRMAHTRALNRALRALLGYGATTAEEIPDGPRAPQADNARAASSRGEQVARSIVQGAEPACPHCGSKVWDNRATATGKQPLWKCSNKSCGGGRNGYAWASWIEDQFGPQEAQVVPVGDDGPPLPEPSDYGVDERGETFNDEPLPF